MQRNLFPSTTASSLDPANVAREAAALRGLARSLAVQGNAGGAVELFAAALEHDPSNAEAHFDLGGVLYALGRHEDAVRSLGEAVKFAPANARARHNLGLALSRLGRVPAARAELSAAALLAPEEVGFHRALALLDLSLGHAAEAEAGFRALIDRAPGDCAAHRNLARLATYRSGDPHIAAMERLAARPDLAADARIEIGFALFEALGKAGEHERAFSHLAGANRARRARYPYDAGAERLVFEQLMSVLHAGFFEAEPVAAAAAEGPIFIVGMPRAGTTLVEQILATHSDIAAGGESIAMTDLVRRFLIVADRPGLALSQAAFSPGRRAEMAAFYRDATRAIQGASRFVTDKMPLNFRWIGIIAAILPGARFIHCRRDPVETCFSIHSSFFASGGNRYAHDLADLADYYRQYRRLMAHWHAVLPGRILDVELDDLVRNQEETTRRMLNFVGLDYDDRCLEFHVNGSPVATLSSLQVKKPVYGGHADRLRPWLPYLGPVAELADDRDRAT